MPPQEAPVVTEIYDLSEESAWSAWNAIQKTLEDSSDSMFKGLKTGGLSQARVLPKERVRPMVAVVLFKDTAQPRPSLETLSEMHHKTLNASMAGFVPFSRVLDSERGVTLVLPMGMQKMPSALGYRTRFPEDSDKTITVPANPPFPSYTRLGPNLDEDCALVSNILGKLMAAIKTVCPRMALFTRFAGDHFGWDTSWGALNNWSKNFPHRFVVGWTSYTTERTEYLPTAAQKEMDEIEEALLKLQRKKKKSPADQAELDRLNALLKKVQGPDYDKDADYTTDAKWYTPVVKQSKFGPQELTGSHLTPPEHFGPPDGSGPYYSRVTDTFEIKAGKQVICRIRNASTVAPIKKLLVSKRYDASAARIGGSVLGTAVTCWTEAATRTPVANAALVDL